MRVLDEFEGVWDIARSIRPADGPVARFEGQGIWTPARGGLDYAERGTLSVPGAAPMTAERRYHWTTELMVYFDDGRLFHQVPPGGGETRHWCDPDSYTGQYDFSAWPAFEVSWHVTGPRKDYVMHSRFTRSATP